MSVLVGTRQPRCLVLGLLQSLPWEISQEYPRSVKGAISQEKQEKSVLLKWGKGCCLFSDFNLQKSKKGNQKIKEWED